MYDEVALNGAVGVEMALCRPACPIDDNQEAHFGQPTKQQPVIVAFHYNQIANLVFGAKSDRREPNVILWPFVSPPKSD